MNFTNELQRWWRDDGITMMLVMILLLVALSNPQFETQNVFALQITSTRWRPWSDNSCCLIYTLCNTYCKNMFLVSLCGATLWCHSLVPLSGAQCTLVHSATHSGATGAHSATLCGVVRNFLPRAQSCDVLSQCSFFPPTNSS